MLLDNYIKGESSNRDMNLSVSDIREWLALTEQQQAQLTPFRDDGGD